MPKIHAPTTTPLIHTIKPPKHDKQQPKSSAITHAKLAQKQKKTQSSLNKIRNFTKIQTTHATQAKERNKQNKTNLVQ